MRVTSDKSDSNIGSKNKSTSDHITLASSVGHSTYTHFTLQSCLSTLHIYTRGRNCPPLHGYLSISPSAAFFAQ